MNDSTVPSKDSTASLIAYFESRQKELLEELMEWVLVETPTGCVDGIETLVAKIEVALQDAGVSCSRHETNAGPNLFAELPGKDPPIVLVGHVDTVFPLARRRHGRRDARRVDSTGRAFMT